MKRTVLDDGRTVKFEADEGHLLTTEALKRFGLTMIVPIEKEHVIIEVCQHKKEIINKERDKPSKPSLEKKKEELNEIIQMIQSLEKRVQNIKNELKIK